MKDDCLYHIPSGYVSFVVNFHSQSTPKKIVVIAYGWLNNQYICSAKVSVDWIQNEWNVMVIDSGGCYWEDTEYFNFKWIFDQSNTRYLLYYDTNIFCYLSLDVFIFLFWIIDALRHELATVICRHLMYILYYTLYTYILLNSHIYIYWLIPIECKGYRWDQINTCAESILIIAAVTFWHSGDTDVGYFLSK